MMNLVPLNYRYRDDRKALLAWHFGWYLFHKGHAARMRYVIDGSESIAVACRKAAARNLREFRRLIAQEAAP